MKFVTFLQSLFIPSCMVKRKGMNIFISLSILLLGSLVLALPMINYFYKDRYELFDDQLNFEIFKYCVDEDDTLGAFTEEEKNTYNLVYFKDIKNLGIVAGKEGLGYSESCVNGKEYVVKSLLPIKDDEGTITGYETWYIHIVADYYDANNGESETYSIPNTFCKYLRDEDGTFRHMLVAFYNDGIIFSSDDTYSNALTLQYNRKTDINFNNAEDMTYVSHALGDILFRVYIYQATKKTFLTAFLFPVLIAFIFSFVIKGPIAPLKGTKEFLAVAAVTSITPLLFCTIFSLVNITWCSYAFSYYPFVYIGYFLVVQIFINRSARFKRDELKDFNKKFDEGK